MEGTPTPLPVTPARRRLVLVLGAGRSGATVVAGALRALGMHVPAPEAPGDVAEAQWVLDFHTRLLERAGVALDDARPAAWFETAKVNTFGPLRVELADWLDRQFSPDATELVVKDPPLAWFLGLWRAAALRCAAAPAYVTVLRPVTEVVASRPPDSGRHLGEAAGDVERTAAWVNLMLHTERSTRGSGRAFVRYDDLLSDWTVPLFALGTAFDLQAVTEASANDIRQVHAFVDPRRKRSTATWDDLEVPARLREVAEESWQALNKLADAGGDSPDVHELLDELRASYADLYDEAETLAASSARAARREAARGVGAAASTTASGDRRLRRGLRRVLGRD